MFMDADALKQKQSRQSGTVSVYSSHSGYLLLEEIETVIIYGRQFLFYVLGIS